MIRLLVAGVTIALFAASVPASGQSPLLLTAPYATEDCAPVPTEPVRLRGEVGVDRPVWVIGDTSHKSYDVVWPFGWSAWYTPVLELFDLDGERIAGFGDLLTIEASASSSPEADLIVCRILTVNGREVPYKPLPSFVPLPTVPPDAESGFDVNVCGTDEDESNGRERLDRFSIQFWPTGSLGLPAGPFLIIDGSCTFQRFVLAPGDYRIRVTSPGWRPVDWEDTVVRGGFGEVLIAPRPILLPTMPDDSPKPIPTFQPADRVD